MRKNSEITVCILTSGHPIYDVRVFLKEALTLSSEGYNVSIIAQHDNRDKLSNIDIFSIKKSKNRLDRMTRTVWKVYRKAVEQNADIYHFHDPELLLVGLALKRRGKCVIYDVHEDITRQILTKKYIPEVFRKTVSYIVDKLEKYASKRFDGVIAATDYIKNKLIKYNSNTTDVNNYPFLSEFSNANNLWKNNRENVCYVGAISEVRGAYEMVRAINKTNLKLILAGQCSHDLFDRLKNTEGWRNVEMIGHVERGKLNEVFNLSIAGLVLFHAVPNHKHAQPNKMFEYMSAGIPVIASNFELWKDIIEGNKCGICVNPYDVNQIAMAINFLNSNRNAAKKMGENGVFAIRKKYNWESEKSRLVEFYINLAQKL